MGILPTIWSVYVHAGRIICDWNTRSDKRYFQYWFSDSNLLGKEIFFYEHCTFDKNSFSKCIILSKPAVLLEILQSKFFLQINFRVVTKQTPACEQILVFAITM